MCTKLRGMRVTPGDIIAFFIKSGKASGTWGFNNGSQYNVRLDSVPTIWKKIQYNRGILKADSFWEKDKQFVSTTGQLLNIAVLYNGTEFAVVTTEANPIVKPFHHRMPLILTEHGAEEFLDNKDPRELDFNQIKLVA